MTIVVRYFAVLRDLRGLSQETLDTRAVNPVQLYRELSENHDFPLTEGQIRFAVNGSYVEPTKTLKDGDVVAFIPPVAGG